MKTKYLLCLFVVFQIIFSFADVSYAKLQKAIGIPEEYQEAGMTFVQLTSPDSSQTIFLGGAYEFVDDTCLSAALENESLVEIVGYFTKSEDGFALDTEEDYLCSPISEQTKSIQSANSSLLGTYAYKEKGFTGEAILKSGNNSKEFILSVSTYGSGLCDYEGVCIEQNSILRCKGTDNSDEEEFIIKILHNSLEIPHFNGYCGLHGYTEGLYVKTLQ